VLFSWISFDPGNPIYEIVHEITEPILAPIRSVVPRLGMFDLSPIVAMIVLGILMRASMSLND
jgi:YggT family protein